MCDKYIIHMSINVSFEKGFWHEYEGKKQENTDCRTLLLSSAILRRRHIDWSSYSMLLLLHYSLVHNIGRLLTAPILCTSESHWSVTILEHHIWTRTSWWRRKFPVHHVGLGALLTGAKEKLVHPSGSQAAMYYCEAKYRYSYCKVNLT